MLTYDPYKRISAVEALNDIWIMKFDSTDKVEMINVLNSMNQLQRFKAESELQKAVWSYMSERFITLDQEKKAREVFRMLDVNNDGQLSKQELLDGYTTIMGDPEEAKSRVDEMMEKLDMNQNGTIDYKEFLVANFQNKTMNYQKMLREAFDFFDAVL